MPRAEPDTVLEWEGLMSSPAALTAESSHSVTQSVSRPAATEWWKPPAVSGTISMLWTGMSRVRLL